MTTVNKEKLVKYIGISGNQLPEEISRVEAYQMLVLNIDTVVDNILKELVTEN